MKGRKLDWDKQILWLEAETPREAKRGQEVGKARIPVSSFSPLKNTAMYYKQISFSVRVPLYDLILKSKGLVSCNAT